MKAKLTAICKLGLILAVLFLLNFGLLQSLHAASAVNLNNPITGRSGASVEVLVNNIITALLGLSGVLALVAFVYGGILWITSYGDSGKVEKGKTMMIWSVVGLFLIFSSYAILTLIFKALGFTG